MRSIKNKSAIGLVFFVLLLMSLGCTGGDPAPQEYQGNWRGSDGSTMYMHGDGSAGFKVGSKTVDGGGAVIDEAAGTITISLFGISHTWNIDQKPANDEMVLDGVTYTKN